MTKNSWKFVYILFYAVQISHQFDEIFSHQIRKIRILIFDFLIFFSNSQIRILIIWQKNRQIYFQFQVDEYFPKIRQIDFHFQL